jgi:uncharacterized protein YgiM (DUF1202 family)
MEDSMKLNKKVIESTIVAVLLLVVTTVTVAGSSARTVKTGAEEKVASVEVKNNGVAGIINELATTQASTGLDLKSVASVEKTNVVTVGAAATDAPATAAPAATPATTTPAATAAPAAPALTPEQQEWSNKLMANVAEFLNVRSQPDENAEVIGKLFRGDRADLTEQLDGWYHIVSGNVDGYVKADYCITGVGSLDFAKEVCTTTVTVQTDGLRVRAAADETSDILTSEAQGDKMAVRTDAAPVDGWVAVDFKGSVGYVKADYVTVAIDYGTAITVAEEQAQIAKAAAQAAKAAAKKAAQSTTRTIVQNNAVSASYDDVTLLGALIQCEAGSEPYEGKVAVGAVVMNRMRSGSYPSSISGVIYQSGQFTPAGSGRLAAALASGVNGSCIQAAQEALGGADNTGGARNFKRASGGQSGNIIGNHVFY